MNLASVLFLPTVIVLVALTVIAFVQAQPSVYRYGLGAVTVYVVGNAFLDQNLTPEPIIALGAVVVACSITGVITYLVQSRSSTANETPNETLLTFLTLILAATSVVATLSSNEELRIAVARPYIPAEQIQIHKSNGGERQVVGYVLDVDPSGQWTTILRDVDRTIVILNSETIASRTVCRPAGVTVPQPRWPIVTTPSIDVIHECQE